MIGVNTAIFSPSGGNVGIAFAIQASTASAIIDDLRDDGQVTRGYIGVRIQPVSEDIADSLGLKEAAGALVASVETGGPAAAAGVQPGDVIVSVDGNSIGNPRDLSRRIARIEPGSKAEITIFRNGAEKVLSLSLGELQAAASPEAETPAPVAPSALESFGLEVTPNEAGDGLVVTSVDPDGAAADKGIRAGDVILQINGEAVRSAQDMTDAVDAARELDRNAVLVQVERDENSRFLALPIDEG